MPENIKFDVPTSNGELNIEIPISGSLVFIGANGAGKTRLGVRIDRTLSTRGLEVHRIAAHRSLALNTAVVPPSYEAATKRLRFGYDQGDYRNKDGHRWHGKPETAMLNDFDHLVSALYAENNDISIAYRNSQVQKPTLEAPPAAKIDQLKTIWQSILPHRELSVQSGNIKTKTIDNLSLEYDAAGMSDGERVIFYLVAQSLLAQLNAILIFDEPELHINKSVLERLWDVIESARPDCTFIYITHDIDFASSRHAATKFAIRSYVAAPSESWDIEQIPSDGGIPDDIVARIVGSRKPMLFVEGSASSLDAALYRRVYNNFTIVAVGSCDQVVNTVATFIARTDLHRFGCAGIIDSDSRSNEVISSLEHKGVYCLPVSEVENLLLLPSVFLAISEALKFNTADSNAKLEELKKIIFLQATQQVDGICLRYTKRRIDHEMKKIGLEGKDIEFVAKFFSAVNSAIDPKAIYEAVKAELSSAIRRTEYDKVLRYFDNKGMLAEAAKLLGYGKSQLEEFIGRELKADGTSKILNALVSYLPKVKVVP